MKYSDDYELPNGFTIGHMRKDNLDWWNSIGKQTDNPEKRERYYQKFLKDIRRYVPGFSLDNYKEKVIGEACGGPYGGLIDVKYEKEEKYQIDIFADDFEKMSWIQQNNSKTTWIASPCEDIDLPDDYLDVLFAFNSLDHGWDIKKSIQECVRVSKHCYINFDTNRHYAPGYPDLNHYQIVEFDEVVNILKDLYSGDEYELKIWSNPARVTGTDKKKYAIRVINFFVGKK